MYLWQKRSKRKVTGGRYRKFRNKRKKELGRFPVMTKIGEKETKELKALGGNKRTKLKKTRHVNVVKGKKTYKAEIKEVLENKANRHYKRMGVITKGALLETDKGIVRVTNRPSKDGFLNGIFVKKSTSK